MNQSTGTNFVPAQYRALAEDVQHTVDNGYEFASENVVASLRTAADQLEAVQAWVDEHYHHFQEISELYAIITGDTAPQEDSGE